MKDRLPARARERIPPFIAAAAPVVGMACCSKGRSLRYYRWPAARRWLDRCGAGVCADGNESQFAAADKMLGRKLREKLGSLGDYFWSKGIPSLPGL